MTRALFDIIYAMVELGEVLEGGEEGNNIKVLDALIELVEVIQENKEELKQLFDIVIELDKDFKITREVINSLTNMYGLDSIGEDAIEPKSGDRTQKGVATAAAAVVAAVA